MPQPETWELNEEEFQAVSGLPAGERYNHLIKRVADWQWLWLLEDDDGLVALTDAEDRRFVAIWPHPRYAEACASTDWAGARPTAIEVHEWVEAVLPSVAEEGSMVSAFPTREHQGFVVLPLGLKQDLEQELSLYE